MKREIIKPYKEPKLTDKDIEEIRKRFNIKPNKVRFKERVSIPRKRGGYHAPKDQKTCIYKGCTTKCKEGRRICYRHHGRFLTSVANGTGRANFNLDLPRIKRPRTKQ